jgi:hypothetical protein
LLEQLLQNLETHRGPCRALPVPGGVVLYKGSSALSILKVDYSSGAQVSDT